MPTNHPASTGYAFISYSTKNQSDADALKALFAKKGIRSWMAPGDIPVGSKYAQVINHAIKECACFVLLLTDAAQNSPWVAKEVERAVNYGKTILPIKMENIVLNEEFEFYISTDQIVAVQKIDENSLEFKKILTTVIAFTGQEPQQEPRQEAAPVEPTVQVTEPESIPEPQPMPEEEEVAPQAPAVIENEPEEATPSPRAKLKKHWLTIVLEVFGVCISFALAILLAREIFGKITETTRSTVTIAEAALIFLIFSVQWLLDVRYRADRIRRYAPMIEKNKTNRMELLANAIGASNNVTKRDLIYASVHKYPGQMYFDHSTNLLIRTDKRVDIRRGMITMFKWYGNFLFGIGYYAFFAAMESMAFMKHEYKLYVVLFEILAALLFMGLAWLLRDQYRFCRNCLTIILGDGVCDIALIAKKMNKKAKTIKNAIDYFRRDHYLKNIYIDEQTQSIVFTE